MLVWASPGLLITANLAVLGMSEFGFPLHPVWRICQPVMM
jgi:hypothetical protein